MPWLTRPLPFHLLTTPIHCSPFTSSLSQHQTPPPPQPTKPPILSPNHSHLLLSLLHHYHPKRNPSLQIHSHLITTALQIHQTPIILWNSLLRLYSQGPFPQEAIHLYTQLLHSTPTPHLPTDTFTFSFLLKASANLSDFHLGSQFHSLVVKKGFEFHLYVQTALVNMYSACGHLSEAKTVFDEMPERNSVSWNAMITGFVQWGQLGHAALLFNRMPTPNVITWTAMIDGYTRVHRASESLCLFRQMNAKGIVPTEVTVLSLVPAISNLGSLESGETLHGICQKRGLDRSDVRVENSLIDMYAKCGSMGNSLRVFEEMSGRRNLVSWNSIVSGFAMNGMALEAAELFEKMRRADIGPNGVTFLSLLNACSHGGLVEEGLRFFRSMVNEFGIEPEIKHYGCVIDMLGRTGRLGEAEEMIARMPVEVNVVVWRTLLGSCSKHGEVEMGERVMKRIMEMEGWYGGDYVVLSNMLTEVGRFGDAEMVRRMLDERNAVKVPGLSLVGGKD